MSIRQISAHEAVVKTATVEVKTLTISGKQVTLAVFRQLVDASVIDEPEPKLLGQPWGQVNYHPDKCVDAPDHIHVVWQKGSDLRRGYVRMHDPGWIAQDADHRDDLAKVAVFRAIGETGELEVSGPGSYYSSNGTRVASRGGFCRLWNQSEVSAAECLAQIARGEWDSGRGASIGGKWHRDIQEARQAAFGALLVRATMSAYRGLTASETWAALSKHRDDSERRIAEHRRLVAELQTLDQLFIAV